MDRSQNQGEKRNRNIPYTPQNTSFIGGKKYKTIWKARKLHDDVINKAITGSVKY